MNDEVMIPSEVLKKSISSLQNDLVSSLTGSQDYFRTLVDQLNIGILIHRDLKILYLNPGLVHLLGYEKAEELVGQSVLIMVPPEHQVEMKNRLEKIPIQGSFYSPSREDYLLKKNGDQVPIEAERISVIYSGQSAAMTIFRDITPRKTAEEALLRSEENFQTIIQNMPDGVMIVDEEGVLFANRTLIQMLGFTSAAELLGRPTFDFIHPDYHDVGLGKSGETTGTGAKIPLKIKLVGKGEKPVYVESSNIPVRFFGKNATMAVMRDITFQNKMEHQAVLNDKLATVGTLASGVAHEINNPLTYVLGNLVFLKEQFEDLKNRLREIGGSDAYCVNLLSEMNDELGSIAEGGEKIREIVKGLKAFVHSNEDEVEKVNLNQVVESAVNMTFHVIKQKARLEKDFAVDLPILTANPGKLQQVFINLLINASQSIVGNHPDENKIRVRTGRNDGHLFVEITDTGKGIPENVVSRIFDPFFTTKPVGEGTGLGLSVCNEILRNYLGTIQVHSQVGKGSTFIVNLPLENGRKPAERNPHVLSGTEHGRVLAVDDEPGSLEILARMLKKENKVFQAFSGVEAMALLETEQGRVDAIVTDVNMPNMSGIELYKAVAVRFPGLERKFIFITGSMFNLETREFFETVSNPCLEKPFTREDLLRAVSRWVGDKAGKKDKPILSEKGKL